MKLGRLGLLLILCLCFQGPILARADWIPGHDRAFSEKPAVVVLESSDALTEVRITFPGVEVGEMVKNGQIFRTFGIPGAGLMGERGKPELPAFTQWVAVPPMAGVELEIVGLDSVPLPPGLALPGQGFGSDSREGAQAFNWDDDLYTRDTFFPEKPLSVGKPVIMRNLRMVPVHIYPIRVNPGREENWFYTQITFRLSYTGHSDENPKLDPRVRPSEGFGELVGNFVLGAELFQTEEADQRGGYLFIIPNSNQVEQSLQPLVEWKRKKGYPTAVARLSETGYSASNIRNYIRNAYQSGEIPPEYVVLVGDESGSYSIPAWTGSWNVSDLTYSLLEGTDFFPEVFVGRLSIRSISQLNTIVSKIVDYESDPFMTDTTWFKRALMIAATHTTISCETTKQAIKRMFLTYGGYSWVDTVFYSGWSIPASQVTNSINSGVSFVNYRGWIYWDGYTSSYILNLNNGWKLPVVMGMVCATGEFNSWNDPCQAEAFLRAGTASNPRGGIACIGPSYYDTSTRFNNCLDGEIFQGILQEKIEHLGPAILRGKMGLYQNFPDNIYGNDRTAVQFYFYTYNLLGDPGLSMWTDVPRSLAVGHPQLISLGSNSLSVLALDDQGRPIPGAYVCVVSGEEIISRGITDDQGNAHLPLAIAEEDTLELTVSRQNYFPYQAKIPVLQDTGFVGFYDQVVDDDSTGASLGNGDGEINPGETVELDIILKNYGSGGEMGVWVVLSTPDHWVAMLDSVANYGDLDSGQVAAPGDSFVFRVNPECPDGTQLAFDLRIYNSSDQLWLSRLILGVKGPDLVTSGITILDGGNGLLDPGETAPIGINLSNNGGLEAQGVAGLLRSFSPGVIILDSVAFFGTIPIGGQGDNGSDSLILSADSTLFPGSRVDFELMLTITGGIQDTTRFTITVGVVHSFDPLGPDAYGYYAFDDTDMGYSQAPEYQWIEIDPDYGGPGTVLPLSDGGDQQDQSLVMNLPFTFSYYGRLYHWVTVCTNGWISMGATNLNNFRNWAIPSALGPAAMIAPFWDDLRLSSGGKVVFYYDSSFHRCLFEWSRVRTAGTNTQETFEVVLGDPAYYPTPSGDGPILFQYHTVSNVPGNYGDNDYATVGIESPDQDDGLEYTYFNHYPAPAAALAPGRAIRFTTDHGGEVEPPVMVVEPNSFSFTVPVGGVSSDLLTVSNPGGSTLLFTILISRGEERSTHLISQFPPTIWMEGESPPVKGAVGAHYPAVVLNSGGPDGYGYTWYDSHEPLGPPFRWADITGVGDEIVVLGDDSNLGPFPLGFDFPFYGESFSSFRVCCNGWISFTSTDTSFSNYPLPDPAQPENLLAIFWDDLSLEYGGQVFYYVTAESLVVSFIGVPGWGPRGGPYTFQAVLTWDGGIVYQYLDMGSERLDETTVGIQNGDGSIGLTVVHNAPYVEDSLAVGFYPPIRWLTVDPDGGMVMPDSIIGVSVQVDASDLVPGAYGANLLIQSNAPGEPIGVPVSLTVGNPEIVPDIFLSASEHDFGTVLVGGEAEWGLVVSNQGQADLVVDSLYVDQGPFSVALGQRGTPQTIAENISFTLNPGQSQLVLVSFQPVQAGDTTGSLIFISNDPEESPAIVSLSGTGTMVSLNPGQEPGVPTVFSLTQNAPNPFNASTLIRYGIPEESWVNVHIYNLLGQKVATLVACRQPAGFYHTQWQAEDYASGVYLCRITARKGGELVFTKTIKMVCLK